MGLVWKAVLDRASFRHGHAQLPGACGKTPERIDQRQPVKDDLPGLTVPFCVDLRAL